MDNYINEKTTREEINGYIAAAKVSGYDEEEYGFPCALTPEGNLYRVALSDEEAQRGWKNYLRATLTEFTAETLSAATGIPADQLNPRAMKESELAELIEKHYGLDKFIEEQTADKSQRVELSEESTGEIRTEDGCFAWQLSYSGIPFLWDCFIQTAGFRREVEWFAELNTHVLGDGFDEGLAALVGAEMVNLQENYPLDYGSLEAFESMVEDKVEDICRAVLEKHKAEYEPEMI